MLMVACLSNSSIFRSIVSDSSPRRWCRAETPTLTPSSRPQTPRFYAPARWRIGDAIQCSSSAQHDQDEVQLHTPGLCISRDAAVVQSRRADLRFRHVVRQLLIDGSCASLRHEAPVWPRLFAAIPLICFPRTRVSTHWASRSRSLLERLAQLHNPAFCFDKCLFCLSYRDHLFCRGLFQLLAQSFKDMRCLLRIHGWS